MYILKLPGGGGGGPDPNSNPSRSAPVLTAYRVWLIRIIAGLLAPRETASIKSQNCITYSLKIKTLCPPQATIGGKLSLKAPIVDASTAAAEMLFQILIVEGKNAS